MGEKQWEFSSSLHSFILTSNLLSTVLSIITLNYVLDSKKQLVSTFSPQINLDKDEVKEALAFRGQEKKSYSAG